MSYCDAIKTLPPERRALHAAYHDRHYGFPLHDDNELFCRLILEINQAGLSWELILKKEVAFRRAYHEYWVSSRRAHRGLPGLPRSSPTQSSLEVSLSRCVLKNSSMLYI